MLKKSASVDLVSLRGSTYRSVRLASSLTAALLNGLFEHPSWHFPVALDVQISVILACTHSFSRSLLKVTTKSDRIRPHGRHQNPNPLRPPCPDRDHQHRHRCWDRCACDRVQLRVSYL